MTRLSDFRIINTLLVFAVVLAGCGGGGGGGGGAAPTSMPPTNVGRNPTPMPPVVVTPPVAVMPPVVAMTPMLQTFDAGTPTAAELTGAGGNDVWTIAGDATGNSPALDINGLVQAGGGHEGDEHSAAFTLRGGAVGVSITFGTTTEATYTLGGGTFAPTILGAITSGFALNTFVLRTDITGDDPALRLGGAFINTGASGEFRINSGGVAGRIDFTDTPLGGIIGLQNIDTITIDGGTVNGVINASAATAGVTFNLLSGTITSNVVGSSEDDTFIIGSGITVSGRINGRDGIDTLRLADGLTVDTVDFVGERLTLTFNGGITLEFAVRNIDTFVLEDPIMRTFAMDTPTLAERTGASAGDVFMITGDAIDGPLMIDGVIDGRRSIDELQLNAGAVVNDVRFANDVPTGGDVNLQNFETLTLDGGTVTGTIDASASTTTGTGTTGITFNLIRGVAGSGDITGSGRDDIFIIAGSIVGSLAGSIIGATPDLDINGLIQAGVGQDEVRLVNGGVVRFLDFAHFLDEDLSLREVEVITIDGGIVNVAINARAAPAGVTFNLRSGSINGPVIGSSRDDIFVIGSGITISGTINGGAGMDTLSLDFTPASANLFGGILTFTFSGGSLILTLANIEDIDIADLTTTPLPPDYTLLGTPDTYFMAGGGFEAASEGVNILDASNIGYRGLTILGTRIEGARAGSNFVRISLPPLDVRGAWRDGWSGSESSVLVVDSFGGNERHGYLVMLSVLTSASNAPLFALEAGLRGSGRNFGDDGGLRAAFNAMRFSETNNHDIPFDVINASFGFNPIRDRAERESTIREVEQSGNFYLELIGIGRFLSAANVRDATITKAAGNESADAGFVPDNVAYARSASIGPRLLIVGATEGYYDQTGGASIASYSNFAGSDPVVRARFIVANGDSPLVDASAFINNRLVSTAGRGTSYAAPRVAGYVALLRHKFPNLTGYNSADVILDTATYEGLICAPNCSENIYGQGRVDIHRALAPVGSMR